MAAGRAAGYVNSNVKVAPDVDFDVALCRRVKTLAPDGFLRADGNCGYDADTALAVAPKLADAGVQVLTDPDVSLAAAVALFPSCGQQKPRALSGPQFLAHSVLAEPLLPAGGRLATPSGPGLGIMVDDQRRRAIAAPVVPGASSRRDITP